MCVVCKVPGCTHTPTPMYSFCLNHHTLFPVSPHPFPVSPHPFPSLITLLQETFFLFGILSDLTIFLVVMLIFGVVIDTFGDLSAEKNKKEFMLQNTCFICGKCEKWKGRGVELTQMCKRAGSTSFMQAKDNRLLSVSLSCKIWSDNALTIPPGLQRSEFENKEVTFEFHISREHNLWHYLYFIVHVNTKAKTELTGPESYVYKMISVSRLADH